jgi:pantoate--beta-alanine ligase
LVEDSQRSHFLFSTPDSAELRRAVGAARRDGQLVGCVPTMGALHAGHVSLIARARAECDFVVVTLFVNPTQFGPQEDYARYPRPFEADAGLCRSAGVDLLFCPARESMYPAGYATFVEVRGLSASWEGAVRPEHFLGVATVVTKLLNLVAPDRAYFGQKDYQQQALIRRMCRDLDIPVEIVTCPTVRDPDGLALSSRNAYLSSAERTSGLSLYRALCLARDRVGNGERNLGAVRQAMRSEMELTPGVTVDYATIADVESLIELTEPAAHMVALVAARVGPTRLIDNMLIP